MTEFKTEKISLETIKTILNERRVVPTAALLGESATDTSAPKLERPVEALKVLVDEDLSSGVVPLALGPFLTFDQALRRGHHEGGKETLITMLTVSVMSVITVVWAYLVL